MKFACGLKAKLCVAIGCLAVCGSSALAVTRVEEAFEAALEEVPASCGFPVFESQPFWNVFIAAYPECHAVHVSGYRIIRVDDGPTLAEAGERLYVFGQTLHARNCPPCCCDGRGGYDAAEQQKIVTKSVTITRTRGFEQGVGAEVSGGVEVGAPFAGKVQIESRLRESFGQNGSTTLSDAVEVSVAVPGCWWKKEALRTEVRRRAMYEIHHTYTYEVQISADADCPQAGLDVDLMGACPNARVSWFRGEDWNALDYQSLTLESEPCDEEGECP